MKEESGNEIYDGVAVQLLLGCPFCGDMATGFEGMGKVI